MMWTTQLERGGDAVSLVFCCEFIFMPSRHMYLFAFAVLLKPLPSGASAVGHTEVGVQSSLARYWRGTGEVLAKCLRGAGEVLARCWRGAGE
eukprot:15464927-Alexandrium_andersonii.AAC.1